MHGILTLSAVHLARMKTVNLRRIYTRAAVFYQNQGLRKCCSSLFCCCSSFSIPPSPWPSLIQTHCGRLLSDNPLCAGCTSNLSAADYLQSNILKPLLQWDDLEQRLTDDARLSFEKLREAIYVFDTDSSRHAYLKAIDVTQDSLIELIDRLHRVAAATRVAIGMPSIYVALLRTYGSLA